MDDYSFLEPSIIHLPPELLWLVALAYMAWRLNRLDRH